MLSNSRIKSIFLCIIAIILAIIVLIQIISVSAVNIDAEKGMKVPIIMYHSVLDSERRSGDFVISTKTLENDLLYLRQNGYSPIFISDLINYVNNSGTLPQNPVVLTFDDGFYNSLAYVLPLLEKYDMKASVSVVGYYSKVNSECPDKNPSYAYLTWDDILDLLRTKRIEIGNHSFNMHSHTKKRAGSKKNKYESEDDYYSLFLRDTLNLQDMLKTNCDYQPYFYTYPFGFYCEQSEKYLKQMGFKATLTCEQRMNYITKDPECLYLLGRYNRPSGISTEAFMKKVLK